MLFFYLLASFMQSKEMPNINVINIIEKVIVLFKYSTFWQELWDQTTSLLTNAYVIQSCVLF